MTRPRCDTCGNAYPCACDDRDVRWLAIEREEREREREAAEYQQRHRENELDEIACVLGCLAGNLADGAMLCKSFQLGLKINGCGWWFPGSGRVAPHLIDQTDASPVECTICGAVSRGDRPCAGCGAA